MLIFLKERLIWHGISTIQMYGSLRFKKIRSLLGPICTFRYAICRGWIKQLPVQALIWSVMVSFSLAIYTHCPSTWFLRLSCVLNFRLYIDHGSSVMHWSSPPRGMFFWGDWGCTGGAVCLYFLGITWWFSLFLAW
jgi:hypothetical protein